MVNQIEHLDIICQKSNIWNTWIAFYYCRSPGFFFKRCKIKFQCHSPKAAWKEETKGTFFSIATWRHLKHFCILVVYCFNFALQCLLQMDYKVLLSQSNYVIKMEKKILLLVVVHYSWSLNLKSFFLFNVSFAT